MLAHGFCISRKGGTGGGGWGHLQPGDMHVVAARLGCERAMVGTRWATSHPDCMDRLRKHYSHFVGGCFLPRKAAWALNRCMTTESADHCMVVNNEWAWLRSQVYLLRLEWVQFWSQNLDRNGDMNVFQRKLHVEVFSEDIPRVVLYMV